MRVRWPWLRFPVAWGGYHSIRVNLTLHAVSAESVNPSLMSWVCNASSRRRSLNCSAQDHPESDSETDQGCFRKFCLPFELPPPFWKLLSQIPWVFLLSYLKLNLSIFLQLCLFKSSCVDNWPCYVNSNLSSDNHPQKETHQTVTQRCLLKGSSSHLSNK